MDRTTEAQTAPTSSVSRSDQDLLDAARAGDSSAYDELWTWHSAAARRLASALVPVAAVDGVMDDSYARVQHAIDIDGGPELAFRTYLLSAVRRVATETGRAVTADDSAKDVARQQLALTAWGSLHEDSQALLWHLLVEGESAAQLASLLGTWPSDVASRGKLAGQQFREAVIDESAIAATHSECGPVLDRLGSHVLGRRNGTVRAHLRGCSGCRDAAAILVNNKTAMRGFIAPALLGGLAVAARYLDAGAGRKGVLPVAKSTLGGGAALHLARGVSRPGKAAGVGAVAAASIAVAVAATALATEAPDMPAQAAPRASAPGALPTSTGTDSATANVVPAVERGTTRNISLTSSSSSTSAPIPSASSSSTSTAPSVRQVRPRTSSVAPSSSTSPGTSTSSTPTATDPPSSSPTSSSTARPLPAAPVSGLTYTTSVPKTSVAAIWVTAGWEIASLTDGSGTQHVTTPTGRYDGDVPAGTVTVVVRATTPHLVGNLGAMFTNTLGLLVSGGMNHVLPPQAN